MTFNNSEEYNDPILYDKENDTYTPEIAFLKEWAAGISGPIIDVACGTGRVTIPLAQMGYELIGVDVHEGMLKEAEKKSIRLQLHINWVLQDSTKMNLDRKSGLIYSVGNSFQHFLTNEAQDQLLSSIHSHLEDDGVFIFGTRFPSIEELLQPPTEEYWRSYIDRDTQNQVDLSTISYYDALKQLQYYTTIRKYKDEYGNVVKENKTNICLRYVFPKEMERILFVNGFEIVQLFRDWNQTPISNDSYEMIYVCRKIANIKSLEESPSFI